MAHCNTVCNTFTPPVWPKCSSICSSICIPACLLLHSLPVACDSRKLLVIIQIILAAPNTSNCPNENHLSASIRTNCHARGQQLIGAKRGRGGRGMGGKLAAARKTEVWGGNIFSHMWLGFKITTRGLIKMRMRKTSLSHQPLTPLPTRSHGQGLPAPICFHPLPRNIRHHH